MMKRLKALSTGKSSTENEKVPCAPKPGTKENEHSFLQLHHIMGNRAFGSMIQTKLRVSQPGEAFEQEADRVADQIASMEEVSGSKGRNSSDLTVEVLKNVVSGQTKREPEEDQETVPSDSDESIPESSLLSLKGAAGSSDAIFGPRIGYDPSHVRIHTDPRAAQTARTVSAHAFTFGSDVALENAEYQPHTPRGISVPVNRNGKDSSETTREFQSKLESSKSNGQSLDDSTRSELESRIGADFSGVKIHTGSEAHSMSENINAKAFTHGQDIFFKQGEFNTDSHQGKELLAHELVHTKQRQPGVRRQSDPDAKKEEIPKLPEIESWEYKNKKSDKMSDDNYCDSCGGIELGVNAPSPVYLCNGIEMKANIRGHRANYSYDIKRTYNAVFWEKVPRESKKAKATSNSFDQKEQSSATPAKLAEETSKFKWVRTGKPRNMPDDATDSDEYLVPQTKNPDADPEEIDPSKIYYIYSKDRPGLSGRPNLEKGAVEVLFASNFTEFVRITNNNEGASHNDKNVFRWHSVIHLELKDGSWSMNESKSSIGESHVSLNKPEE